MRTFIKWLAVFLAGAHGGALLEPWLQSWYKSLFGWDEDPNKTAGVAMNFMSRIIGETAFHWAAGFAFGFFVGVWLDTWLRRKEGAHKSRRRSSRDMEIAQLILDMENVSGRIGQWQRNPFHYELGASFASEAAIVINALAHKGFIVPAFSENKTSEENALRLKAYLDGLLPFMHRGMVDVAKEQSSALTVAT